MFNYKDLTYLRVAILGYIQKLSSVQENDAGVGEDRFADIQDDVQYLERLRDIVEREISAVRVPSKAENAKLSVVPSKPQ